MDQLNIEKKGIPTVTIATGPFEEAIKKQLQDEGVGAIAMVIVEHPIAGLSVDGIKKKAEAAFPAIVKAATEWQPSGK